MSTEVARILRDAADLLVNQGWTNQGWGAPSTGPRCVLHAICAVDRDGQVWDESKDALCRFLGVEGGLLSTLVLGRWNDHHVTAEPVVAALRAAGEAEASL